MSLVKKLLVAAGILFVLLALGDSLHLFDHDPYVAVPHGDHVHYVPRDRSESASLDDFPMTRPGPNQRILPDGRVVEIR